MSARRHWHRASTRLSSLVLAVLSIGVTVAPSSTTGASSDPPAHPADVRSGRRIDRSQGETKGALVGLSNDSGSGMEDCEDVLPIEANEVHCVVTMPEEVADVFRGLTTPPSASRAEQTLSAVTGPVCVGDGTAGRRVEVLYVVAAGKPNRFASVRASLETYINGVDDILIAAAAQTGGFRRVRWVTDSPCRVRISPVVIPDGADATFQETVAAVQAAGFDSVDRKYLMFRDSAVECGRGMRSNDSSPGPTNMNNTSTFAVFAIVDTPCWNSFTATHELGHNLGAVSSDAPNSNGFGHCTDENDIMCYPESGIPTSVVCTGDSIFDCNHDDYFSTNPPAGSYLATHWNLADSSFLLSGTEPVPAPPAAPTAVTVSSRVALAVISWAPSAGTVESYTVTASPGVHSCHVPASIRTCTFDQLTDGTNYAFSVAAENSHWTGLASAPVSARPPGDTRPLSVAVRPGVDFAQVDWLPPRADAFNPPDRYVVSAVPGGQTCTRSAPATSCSIRGLTNGVSYAFSVVASGPCAWACASWSTAASEPVSATVGSGFTSLSPVRLFDTRAGEAAGVVVVSKTKVGGVGNVLRVKVAGVASVPVSGVGAVSLNVTVVDPVGAGFVTVFPCGNRPNASSLNFVAGQTVPNAVLAPVSANGEVCFFASLDTDLIADINGWFTPLSDFSGYSSLAPVRLFDTRVGQAPGAVVVSKRKVGGVGNVLRVRVGDSAGLPLSRLAAVSLNVTVVDPAGAGFVTVYPCGTRPNASSLNFVAGQTVPNVVLAQVSATAEVCFFASVDTDLIADVNGWFAHATGFSSLSPVRLFDTRVGEAAGAVVVSKTKVGGVGNVLRVKVAGVASVPASGVGAVSLNVTVVDPLGAGFVTVFPCGNRPNASSLNFVAGQTVPNAVLAPVSADGEVCFFASVDTDLIADINGWFTP